MTVFGWDASDFDHDRGSMDLAAARRDGIDFFTHKLTEGASVTHNGGPSLARARDAGMPFLGAYMVSRTPGASVSAQVTFLIAQADRQCGWWREHPGWFWQVDTEHWSYDNVPASVGHEAAQLLAQRTGKVVLHYAPEWAYGGSVPAGEPLWASSYVTGAGPYRALYPGDSSSHWRAYSGRVPAILQYSSTATIGTQQGCDANAFRGTVADFAALIHGGQTGVADMPLTPNEITAIAVETAQLIGHGGDIAGRILGRAGVDPSAASFIDKFNLEAVEARLSRGLTDAQIATIGDKLATALVARPDNPLGDADKPAIKAALVEVLREGTG